MVPIHQLLSRIRWDKEFARSDFEIGYHDRVRNETIIIRFREIHFPENERRTFELVDDLGHHHRIPYHRVREVYKDGELIWKRSAERH